MSEAVATGERLPKSSYQPCCQRSRPFDRDLLAAHSTRIYCRHTCPVPTIPDNTNEELAGEAHAAAPTSPA
jgi:methylphosphotriester-DNA--protein-cysteine methyltransferase